jgi:hypothetical protein
VLVEGALRTIFYIDGSKYETPARDTGTFHSHSIMTGIILSKTEQLPGHLLHFLPIYGIHYSYPKENLRKSNMNQVFKKLQFKDHKRILVLNAPAEFKMNLAGMADVTVIHDTVSSGETYDFVLIFVKNCMEIRQFSTIAKTHLDEDAILWFAYPKKSSKRYQSDISRDDGWQPLGKLGFEGVRQIAIDDDWSALRFRQARYIKTMSRDQRRAMSKDGKKRAE